MRSLFPRWHRTKAQTRYRYRNTCVRVFMLAACQSFRVSFLLGKYGTRTRIIYRTIGRTNSSRWCTDKRVPVRVYRASSWTFYQGSAVSYCGLLPPENKDIVIICIILCNVYTYYSTHTVNARDPNGCRWRMLRPIISRNKVNVSAAGTTNKERCQVF